VLTLGTEGLFANPAACHPILYSRIFTTGGTQGFFYLVIFHLLLIAYWPSGLLLRVRNADSGRKT
jgi:hypothetical protein